jgi:hypothetical protein
MRWPAVAEGAACHVAARCTNELGMPRLRSRMLACAPDPLRMTGEADTYRAYFPIHWSTQSLTVLYQSWEFCGFSTQ